jgi:hypothetical protein
MQSKTIVFPLCALAAFLGAIRAAEPEPGAKATIEAPSPDGQFAFRYSTKADGERKSYDLIEKKSGRTVTSVAESDPDLGPSGRFNMEVLWRPDSKAFALTATFWKRGSEVIIYQRVGAAFREVKIPELLAEIPDKIKRGKEFPHVVELNSQSAIRWQKDGSVVIEIESIEDGNGSSIKATRTVSLSFDQSGKAKLLKSSVKFAKGDE